MTNTACIAEVNPDWQNSLDVLECNKYMLENSVACDVGFLLQSTDGTSEIVSAHKYVLMSRNPVFFAMFTGPMAEVERTIRVTDVSPEAFRSLLRYLYYEEIQLTMDSVFPILYTAKKYLVNRLEKLCLVYLEENVQPENVCTLIECDFLYAEQESLAAKCWDIVQKQTERVLQSPAFGQLSRDSLAKILRLDRLSICEVDLFRACHVWAQKRCVEMGREATGSNMRTALGEALFSLRLPSMSSQELSKLVVSTGILSMEEENALYRSLNGGVEAGCLGTSLRLPFPTRPRQFVSFECSLSYEGFGRQSTTRIGMIDSFLHRSKWSMGFTVDQDVVLNEITFYGQYKGSVQIVQNGETKLEVSSDKSVETLSVSSDIIIEPGSFVLCSNGPYTYCGEYFSKSILAPLPAVRNDDDHAKVTVRECSTLCFLRVVAYSHSNQLHFVENYFDDHAADDAITAGAQG